MKDKLIQSLGTTSTMSGIGNLKNTVALLVCGLLSACEQAPRYTFDEILKMHGYDEQLCNEIGGGCRPPDFLELYPQSDFRLCNASYYETYEGGDLFFLKRGTQVEMKWNRLMTMCTSDRFRTLYAQHDDGSYRFGGVSHNGGRTRNIDYDELTIVYGYTPENGYREIEKVILPGEFVEPTSPREICEVHEKIWKASGTLIEKKNTNYCGSDNGEKDIDIEPPSGVLPQVDNKTIEFQIEIAPSVNYHTDLPYKEAS